MKLQEDQFLEEQGNNNPIDLKRLLAKILFNWYWILLSIIVCLTTAYLYAKYQTPIFKISARVLVNDEKKGGGLSGGSNVLGDLGGLLGGKSTVDNEVEILKTRSLMEKVVRDMKLNITYFYEGNIRQMELYQTPFIVQGINTDTIYSTHVKLKFLKNNKFSLTTKDTDIVLSYGQLFNLPGVGNLRIERNFAVPVKFENYSFEIVPIDTKVAQLIGNLTVGVNNKLITIIDLSLNYALPKKGEDILNRLIYNYVQSNLKDKNEVADSTIKFIHNRLAIIGGELGDLEGNIQGFKQKNSLADMTEQGKLLVASTGQFVVDLAAVETKLSILTSLEEYLKDSNVKRVLPSSLLPEDIVFSNLIEKYNTLLLDRDRKLLSVTETNPVIINLDEQISNLRKDMLTNVYSTRKSFQISRNKIISQIKNAEGEIRQVPETERNYLNLARQQQIKQELYIFLMQKSEETAISKTANIANSRTIDPPKSDVIPFSPKKQFIFIIGLSFGLLIPIGGIYLKEVLNTRVESKEDINNMISLPVIGEISHNSENDNLVVANSSRSAIAEQFRALRTNLSFYLKSSEEKVILLTSSMSGEGKSFVAINLGNILALSGKKVLLMELDLRKPGLSAKLNISNGFGFTNYIINSELQSSDIIKPLSINPNLYIISSGPIPPNPAETIMSVRTKKLLDELKGDFDYIIVDAPPIGIVTDAQLIESFSNICLYLVRQNFTFKQQLNIAEDLYKSKKMKNIAIVVNDIHVNNSYGYGYGYGYEYGTYNDIKRIGFFEKIRNKFYK